MRSNSPQDKTALRRELAARRTRVLPERRAREAAALAAALPGLLEDDDGRPVCLHVPVRTEPGADPDHRVPPLLAAAVATGRRVLLPVVVGDAPLDWAEYTGPGDLAESRHRLLEPTGPRRGPDAIADAGMVLLPALAVDRRGTRLGRGAGHYDRSLPRAGAATVLVAVVRDDELVDTLPAEPHDVRVHAVWRPSAGFARLGETEHRA